MPSLNTTVQSSTVTSRDGAVVAYLSVGRGPGVIVVPGALATAADMIPFASMLGNRFTVHILERRGRGDSARQDDGYSIDTECDDVLALQRRTGARFICGHSYGGLVALETAIRADVFAGITAYDPGVSVNGSVPVGWMRAYTEHLEAGRPDDAFVEFVVGVSAPGRHTLPRWLMKRVLALVLPRARRDKIRGLLRENLREHAQVARLDDTYARYGAIRAPVLVMCSGRGHTEAAAQAAKALQSVLPSATILHFPKLDHLAIEGRGAGAIAAVVADFFSAAISGGSPTPDEWRGRTA